MIVSVLCDSEEVLGFYFHLVFLFKAPAVISIFGL